MSTKAQKKRVSSQCGATLKRCLPEEGAKKSAEKFAKTSINGKMYAYKCMFCVWWHLSHQKQH